jgi:phosphoribosyl 1,2-cyclic phosphodiesterase
MAKLKVLATGSSGNCYVVECTDGYYILECGIRSDELLKAVDFDPTKVRAVLVSHEHGDHAKYIKDIINFGFKLVFSTPSCAAKYGTGVRALEPKKRYRFGEMEVIPLKVKHQDVECYAYYMKHPNFGSLVFATDCEDFPYTIKGVNHLLIEANYSEDVISEKLMSDEVIMSNYRAHMSVETTEKVVRRFNSEELQNVVLIHMSHSNCDGAAAVRLIQEAAPMANVAIAKKNFIISHFNGTCKF